VFLGTIVLEVKHHTRHAACESEHILGRSVATRDSSGEFRHLDRDSHFRHVGKWCLKSGRNEIGDQKGENKRQARKEEITFDQS
jgi:hypothetical protein